MEWVETTGRTVEEAKEKALDQLGVHEEDAEFEVLDEPKAGLFGRVRGEARVRARVRPTPVRQKIERRDRKRGGERTGERSGRSKGDGARSEGAKGDGAKQGGQRQGGGQQRGPKPQKSNNQSASSTPAGAPTSERTKEQDVDPRQVGAAASQFVQGLLDAFGATGSVEVVQDGDDFELQVHGQELGLLVGPRGVTLQAVQDLARVASQRRLGDHDTRLRVDIGGYRQRRAAALGEFAQRMAAEVKSSGVARVLEPMSSADRKVIHDTLSGVDGIATRSEGDDPNRRVVIAPAND